MASNYQTSAQSVSRHGVTTDIDNPVGTIRSVPLSVAGQRITLRTDQNPEYLQALSSEINALVESLQQSSPGTGMPTIMALAMMQLLDRAVCAEQAVERENMKVESHIARLNDILKTLDAGNYQA